MILAILHILIEKTKHDLEYVITGMVLAIQLNVLEFFYRVRIFNFFAYFVRQFQEICYDSMPLGSILAFIVVTQSLLFWIIDQNQSDSENQHYKGVEGFFGCLMDSYRLALGDFVMTENFSDSSQIMFWFVFFVGTLISLLIILNMVIAVMSSTFERVAAETQAQIYRTQLTLISNNFYKLDRRTKREIAACKYVVCIDVEPDRDDLDSSNAEQMVANLTDKVSEIEQNIEDIAQGLRNVELN